MFVTHTEFVSPMNQLSTGADEQFWEGVALVFEKQWVMVTVRHMGVGDDGDKTVVFKTILLNNFSSILRKIFMAQKGNVIEFVSGYIFMPAATNSFQIFNWSMEAVSKVWLAESDDDPGVTLEVCETKSGRTFIVTRFVDQNIRLKNLKLICEFK